MEGHEEPVTSALEHLDLSLGIAIDVCPRVIKGDVIICAPVDHEHRRLDLRRSFSARSTSALDAVVPKPIDAGR